MPERYVYEAAGNARLAMAERTAFPIVTALKSEMSAASASPSVVSEMRGFYRRFLREGRLC